MPLTAKGEEILANLERRYGAKKGEQVLYAGKNKGTFTGIDGAKLDAVCDAAAALADASKETIESIRRLYDRPGTAGEKAAAAAALARLGVRVTEFERPAAAAQREFAVTVWNTAKNLGFSYRDIMASDLAGARKEALRRARAARPAWPDKWGIVP